MSIWEKVRIEEIGEVVGGATPSTKNPEFYEDGTIPWITPRDLSTHRGRYIFVGERNITPKGYESCSTKLLPKGSILFSSRAPIGYIAIAGRELCTNQGFKSVVPNKDIYPLFVYYLLLHYKNKIKSMGSGTTFKEVSGKVMKNINVYIPADLTIQKNISKILGSIDSKIENNIALNKNLAGHDVEEDQSSDDCQDNPQIILRICTRNTTNEQTRREQLMAA